MRTKAALDDVYIEQLYTFGDPGRDPRTRVISVAYYALVDARTLERRSTACVPPRPVPTGSSSPGSTPVVGRDRWCPSTPSIPPNLVLPLAFDHASILGTAVRRIRGKVDYAPIGFELLPERFSLRDLRLVHEAILGRELNKDSFRRRILDRGLVVATGEREQGVGHRPPELYRFADPEER